MYTLAVLITVALAHDRDRKGKHKDPGSPRYRQKLHNWDFSIFGHRGGASGFIPDHSILSYTIGAQHGADYLEPDITFTNDGVQIIRHHPNIAEATNVDTVYGQNSDKYTPDDTIEYYWRTQDEGGPSPNPYTETSGGYFSWDFSLNEVQSLSLISTDLQPSPMDDMELKVMTFEELLILITEQLSPTLGRPIGISPEIKYHHEFAQRLRYDVELPHLELLAQYGYLRKENSFFYVRTLCEFALDIIGLSECDDDFYGDKAAVELQSFNAPSLKIFREYTDAPLVYLGWYPYDLLDDEWIDWIERDGFADGIGLNTDGIEAIKETLKGVESELFVYEYTQPFKIEFRGQKPVPSCEF